MKKNTSIQNKHWLWIALVACISFLAVWTEEQFVVKNLSSTSYPVWLPFIACIIVLAGITGLIIASQFKRLFQLLNITGLFLMVWLANGILFDFLKMAGLIGDPVTREIAHVDWPGAILRMLAFANVISLARIVLTDNEATKTTFSAGWYGYAAFALALPYPVFRIIWAFGGTPGLLRAGGGGEGLAPLVPAIPWIMAAILSLMLVTPRPQISRKLLLTAGWAATAIVASIGPAAFWTILSGLIRGDLPPQGDIKTWIFCLFYGSWFFWAIAAFAATRSYQLRSRIAS